MRQLLLIGISTIPFLCTMCTLPTLYKLMDFFNQQEEIVIGNSALIYAELQALFLSVL